MWNPKKVRSGMAGIGVIALTLVVAVPAWAQDTAGSIPTVAPVRSSLQPAPVPFGPGEEFTYKVKYGFMTLGKGSLGIPGIETVRGVPSYHIRLTMNGGKLGLNVNDDYSSYLGIEDLASRRYIQDIHQVRYHKKREYEIYPDERRWERLDVDEDGETLADKPLDEIAFLYWVRTLPLEVGESYTYRNYFKDRGNPVVLHVLRRETIEVPAGEFETIVVQPIIQSRGMFSEDGEAEVYFTDDDRRMLVRLETKMSIGNLSLHLETFQHGRALASAPVETPPVGR